MNHFEKLVYGAQMRKLTPPPHERPLLVRYGKLFHNIPFVLKICHKYAGTIPVGCVVIRVSLSELLLERWHVICHLDQSDSKD